MKRFPTPHGRRRPVGVALVALAALAASLGSGLSSLPTAMAGRTVTYTPPPDPTPPNPMPVRPAGLLAPDQGALFGMHTIPDQAAKDPSGMGITKREQQLGRTLDVIAHRFPGLAAELGEDAEPQIGLRFTLLPKDGGRVIEGFHSGSGLLVGQNDSAQDELITSVRTPLW